MRGLRWSAMKCPSCSKDNREGAAFCDGCGAPLAPKCANCDAQLRPGAKFCDTCGTPQSIDTKGQAPPQLAAKILSERGRIEGERRTVTILFADAKGFTPLSERLDAEQVYTFMQSCYGRMVEAVHRHEGTISQFTGDGIMAIFGAPIAHEDSARRAVSAALEMQQTLRDFVSGSGVDTAFRVGLNTGPVVAGTITDDLTMDYSAIGDTSNLAARMEQMCEPGAVYMTDNTYRQVSDYFDVEDLGLLDVKGKSEQVHVYKAIAERGVRTRLDAAVARGLSPFLGRDRELNTLQSFWQEALAGRGQIVLISGAPGIGKSRLLLEFQRSLGPDVIWREAHCVSYGENIPYLPVVELVKSGFGITDADDDGSIIARVDEDTSQWSPEAQKTVPYLKFLLQVDPGDEAVVQMDPMERRAGILDALRALVLERSRVAPRVVIVEDLHWADTQSEEAFRACADVIAASPVLMILTFRPGYLHPSADLPHANRIVLSDLDHDARAQLAAATLEASALSADLATPITNKAEGNPLFIEEVTKALASGIADTSAVPNSLQDVILARIDRLEHDARESLQLASVIGREFTLRLLNRISDLHAQLEGVLTELKTLELIYEKSFFPELAYMFKHALTHDVAYSTLLVERRKTLHRVVAMAIEELYADRIAEHSETLAHHYEQAEVWDKAIDYLARSAEKAVASFSNADAARFYERAISICARVGEHKRAAELTHRRAIVNLSVFAIADAIEDLEKMRTTAETLSDDHLVSLALADLAIAQFFAHEFDDALTSAERALEVANGRYADATYDANIALTGTLVVTGRLEEGWRAYDRSVQARTQDSEQLFVSLSGEFDVLRANWQGNYDEAITSYRRWIEHLSPHGAVATVPTSWAGAVAMGGRGDYERALAILTDVIATCERTGAFPDFMARCLNTAGWISAEIYDGRAALDWNDRGLSLAQEIESADPEFENNALLNLGDVLLSTGDLTGAQEQFSTVERVVRNPRPHDQWMLWRYSQHLLHSLGELSIERGDLDHAMALADECIELATRTTSPRNIVKGRRLRASVLLHREDLDEAEEELALAASVARRIANPPQLWKTLATVAELRRRQGRRDDAGLALDEAARVIAAVADQLDVDRKATFLESAAIRTTLEGSV